MPQSLSETPQSTQEIQILKLTDFSELMDFSVLRNRGSPGRNSQIPRCFHPFYHIFRELTPTHELTPVTCELITHELITQYIPTHKPLTHEPPIYEPLSCYTLVYEPRARIYNECPPVKRKFHNFSTLCKPHLLTTIATSRTM